MIVINEPYIEEQDNKTKLICDILIDNNQRKVYFEVDKEYGKYLCYERCDAFLIVIFFYAMREKKNIICKGPVTEDLYYQITEYLMPIFEKKSHNKLKKIKIKAKLEKNIENIGAVGTGLTCGVDSFHSIYNNINHKIPRNKLTHLLIMSPADSYKKNGNYIEISKELYNKAELISNQLNLPLIKINSNMRELFPIPPMHTLIRIYGVYALQKLFSIYYFSSGFPIWTFNLEDCDLIDSARYDLLICKELSTKNLTIYSEGTQLTRMDKLKTISEHDLVKQNLHVCIKDSKNCSKCSKCIRTMACLDSMNILDQFNHVFDVSNYYNNIDEYLRQIVYLYQKKDLFVYEFIDKLRKKYKEKSIFKKIDFNNKENICSRCYRVSDHSIIKSKRRIIGIAGGSSSGKSTVAELLNKKLSDSKIIKVDKYMIKYLDIYKKQIIEKLNIPNNEKHWCNYIYNNYSDVQTWINILKKDIENEINREISNCNSKNIIIDSFMLPLLDIFKICDITIAVSSNIDYKLPRIKKSLTENNRINLFNTKSLRNRLNYTNIEKKHLFDYKIVNNYTIEKLIEEVNNLVSKISYFDEV